MGLVGMLLVFLTGNIHALKAQDVKADVRKITEAYKNAKWLSMDVEYSLYKSHTSAMAAESEKATLRLSKELYYYKAGPIELIKTAKLSLMVDHSSQALVLGPSDFKQLRKPVDMDLDSILSQYKSVEYRKQDGESASYNFTFNTGQYTSVKVIFNTRTFLIERMIMNYAKPLEDEGFTQQAPRLEIIYRNTSTRTPFKEDIYSEKQYLTRVKGKYTVKPKFRHYSFVNQLK